MRICKCGNKSGRTYIPELSSEICCADCFSEIIKPKREVVKSIVRFKELKNSYCAVKVIGDKEEIIKEFNKYEDDCAYTNCRNFISSCRADDN